MLAQDLWNGAATDLHNTGGTGRYAAYPARDRALTDGTVAESMRDVFDIYTIIFLALAVFIFLRLRSVLGQRTGRERPPYDPYSAREPARPAGENVVALPNRTPEAAEQNPGPTGRTGPARGPPLNAPCPAANPAGPAGETGAPLPNPPRKAPGQTPPEPVDPARPG